MQALNALVVNIRQSGINPGPPVRLALGLAATLRRRAEVAAPQESCGIVIAERVLNGIRVRDVKLLRNIAVDPVAQFEIDRHAMHRVIARLPRRTLWGIFHSHTLRNAAPSIEDIQCMEKYPGVHLILALPGELRAFVNCDGSLLACPVSNAYRRLEREFHTSRQSPALTL